MSLLNRIVRYCFKYLLHFCKSVVKTDKFIRDLCDKSILILIYVDEFILDKCMLINILDECILSV
jgi:hypothetical protein